MSDNEPAATEPSWAPFTKIMRIVVIGSGAVSLLLGLGLLARELKFGDTALAARGTIADVKVTQNADGETHSPVVEFTTAAQQTVRFEGLATQPPPVRGTQVPVLYNPANLQDARIDTFTNRWLFATVFTAVGFSLMVLGLVSQLGWPKSTQ
jgi:hypothetical protein